MIPIYRLQLAELKKHKLLQVAELEFRCIAAVGDMELAGVKIDVERWRKIIADVAVQRDKAQGSCRSCSRPPRCRPPCSACRRSTSTRICS